MSALTESKLNFPRPLTMVDVVIFTAVEGQLNVLLVKRPETRKECYPGQWALPGGFIDMEEDPTLEACALRKLKEKTGVSAPYLEQLGSWGNAKRDPRGWSATHVYFALLPHEKIVLEKGANAADVAWFPIIEHAVNTRLAFDHQTILETAIQRLRNKAEYTSLPVYLLPDEFTLPELQHVYEVVLGRPLDKSAFRTRVMSSGLLEPVDKQRTGAYRPAQMYRLKALRELVVFPRTFSPKRE